MAGGGETAKGSESNKVSAVRPEDLDCDGRRATGAGPWTFAESRARNAMRAMRGDAHLHAPCGCATGPVPAL